MPLYALQGLVISTFTRNPAGVLGTLVRLGGTVSVVSSLGAVLAWLIGPWAMRLVFGDAFVVSGGLLAALIIAAGLMAMMTLAGWAALSQRRLRAYAWSWASTPVAAVLVFWSQLPSSVRTGASLVVAPAVGLVVLGVWSIRAGRGRRPTTVDSGVRAGLRVVVVARAWAARRSHDESQQSNFLGQCAGALLQRAELHSCDAR